MSFTCVVLGKKKCSFQRYVWKFWSVLAECRLHASYLHRAKIEDQEAIELVLILVFPHQAIK